MCQRSSFNAAIIYTVLFLFPLWPDENSLINDSPIFCEELVKYIAKRDGKKYIISEES
jgi:hypothetical protein